MFYDNQASAKKNEYIELLKKMGGLSVIFSNNTSPYLAYRAHENIFCRCFEAGNLARLDVTADAQIGDLGIALKTWIGDGFQKIAEFNKQSSTFKHLSDIDLARKVSEYRNIRIRSTKNKTGITNIIYHVVKRLPNEMHIYECSLEEIDIDNIVVSINSSSTNTYFTDGKNDYNFNHSKSTLYMKFNLGTALEKIPVQILDDPYNFILNKLTEIDRSILTQPDTSNNTLCLKLYSEKTNGVKFIPPKSGLNQWNGSRLNTKTNTRTPRDVNEVYIPYPKADRDRSVGFFPRAGTSFELTLPDSQVISAKVCQQDGKAIMSNPNNSLGEWLLRKVFELNEGTLVTYEMLQKFGIDCVVFTKVDDEKYLVDFGSVGTYEAFLESY